MFFSVLLPKPTSTSPGESYRSVAQQTKYCGEYTSSQPDVTVTEHQPHFLTWPQVVFRRSLSLLTCLLIVGLGVALRLYFKPGWHCITDQEISSNGTYWVAISNVTALDSRDNSTIRPLCWIIVIDGRSMNLYGLIYLIYISGVCGAPTSLSSAIRRLSIT